MAEKDRYYTCTACLREFGERRGGDEPMREDRRPDVLAPPTGRRVTNRQGLCPECAAKRDRRP